MEPVMQSEHDKNQQDQARLTFRDEDFRVGYQEFMNGSGLEINKAEVFCDEGHVFVYGLTKPMDKFRLVEATHQFLVTRREALLEALNETNSKIELVKVVADDLGIFSKKMDPDGYPLRIVRQRATVSVVVELAIVAGDYDERLDTLSESKLDWKDIGLGIYTAKMGATRADLMVRDDGSSAQWSIGVPPKGQVKGTAKNVEMAKRAAEKEAAFWLNLGG